MSDAGVPENVRRFIAQHIESVVQLEVLVLLQGQADRDYTAAQVAGELRIDSAPAAEQLDRLCSAGVLSCVKNPDPIYRYQPSNPELAQMVDALIQSYEDRRVTIISLIYSKPADKIRIFTDAFRIRKERPDDPA